MFTRQENRNFITDNQAITISHEDYYSVKKLRKQIKTQFKKLIRKKRGEEGSSVIRTGTVLKRRKTPN